MYITIYHNIESKCIQYLKQSDLLPSGTQIRTSHHVAGCAMAQPLRNDCSCRTPKADCGVSYCFELCSVDIAGQATNHGSSRGKLYRVFEKRALRCYSTCHLVADVTKTFTLPIVQHLERRIVCTPASINRFVTLATQ
jgi:hypothetical protein